MAELTLGAVCVRGGSKGVPGKNARMFGGRPLLAWAVDCARQCPSIDRVVVSTDSEELARLGSEAGAEVPFLRPATLARDDSPKWPVFRHLVKRYEELTGATVSILVDLDAGVPLRLPADVEGCIQRLRSSGLEVVTTAYEAERNPYFNMVENDDAGQAHIVKPVVPPVARRQDAPPVFSLSPAAFAIRRDALWRHEHWSQCRFAVHVIPRERAIDIDSEVDFELVQALHRRKER